MNLTPAQITQNKINEICAKHNVNKNDFLINGKRSNPQQTAALREICQWLHDYKDWHPSRIAKYLNKHFKTIKYHLKKS